MIKKARLLPTAQGGGKRILALGNFMVIAVNFCVRTRPYGLSRAAYIKIAQLTPTVFKKVGDDLGLFISWFQFK